MNVQQLPAAGAEGLSTTARRSPSGTFPFRTLPTMTTYVSFSDTGGRIGRIHWANTVPFRGGTIWGQMQWDKIWPAKPEEICIGRYVEAVRLVGKQINQFLATVKQAGNAFAEFRLAVGAAAVEAGKIDSAYIFDTSLKELKKPPHR